MIAPTDKRVKTILVAPADFRRAVEEDPGLAALVGDGWTIGTTVILEDPKAPEDDRQRIALLMIRGPVPVPKVEPWYTRALAPVTGLNLVVAIAGLAWVVYSFAR